MEAILNKLRLTLGMIKFQHSVFALPFALASLIAATNGRPSPAQLILVVLAMVTARNAAMSFNRIVDRRTDAKNPRTQNREIPTGKISAGFASAFCLINCILFVMIAAQFNRLTLWLSPIALLIILGYSITKRFTHFTQFFLGLALGSSPIAAWIAVTGGVSAFPLLLGLAVCLWVAGFDLIYSTLDFEFDRRNRLKNLVVRLGIPRALSLAKILHVFSALFFVAAGMRHEFNFIYYIGCAVLALFLLWEHRLVNPRDLSRVNLAFFTLNGYVSLAYLLFVLLDIYLFLW